MATKQLKVVRPGRYGTRMLKAGDTLEATAPDARLYEALGWATPANRRARVAEAPETRNPPKPKAPRKRRTPAKKKTS